jgi:hypothetical protein
VFEFTGVGETGVAFAAIQLRRAGSFVPGMDFFVARMP